MNLRYAPPARLRRLLPTTHPSVERLQLASRVGWIGLVGVLVMFFVAGVPAIYSQMHTACALDTCQQWQAAPDDLMQLHRLGLSTDAWVVSFIVLDAVLLGTFWSVATALFWNRSRDRMGMFCAVLLLTLGTTFSQTIRATGTLSVLWLLPVHLAQFLSLILLIIFLYVFPNGRFAPPWTRRLATFCVGGGALVVFTPWVVSVPSGIAIPLICVGLAGLFGSGLVAQVYRYRRVSTLSERLQTKWPVSGFAAAIVLFALLGTLFSVYVAQPTVLPPGLREATFLLLAYNGWRLPFVIIPFCVGAAVLRRHLFDIDIIINRTLVYGGLTSAVIAFYVLVVAYLGALFRGGDNLIISLFATGMVAVLFQPMRERLQRGVNRLMYGERDEPYTVLTRLSRRLEGSLVPETVLPTIVETTVQALKLRYAAIALQHDDDLAIVAAAGVPVQDPLALPLIYQGEVLGQFLLASRAPGDPFSPADRRLLDDLARHTGMAAYAVRLTTDLQRSRERLVTAREEERRRLRGDLHDGLGPTLASLFQRLDVAGSLTQRDPAAAAGMLDSLKTEVKEAIADIRRLVYALRPPALDEYGLIAAIQQYAQQFNAGEGPRMVVVAPEHFPPLSAAVEVAAYRIALEAITNVTRHAGAHICHIELRIDDVLSLEVRDDGAGMPTPYHAGVGVTSMRERAGELGGECRIEPGPSGGTQVLVRLPIVRA